jgi:ABC-type phosphate transport system substrate-binding protein
MMFRVFKINMSSNYNLLMRSSLIVVMLILSFQLLGQADWKKITVVGNDIGTENLPKAQISAIFKGNRSRWQNDESVIVVMPSSKHAGCEIMAVTVFGRDMKYVKKYWLNLVFQGRANAPVYLDSNDEILNYVKKHPGAIGILVNYSSESSLKINVL